MANPEVPERQRFCSSCEKPVGRSRDGKPGRTQGFCRNCGTPFSFTPTLKPGDRIADEHYEVLGCIGFVRETPERGRLRLLYVEAEARGMGLGRRLVEACLDHARAVGCAEVVLWTVDVLVQARRIYAEKGFALESSQLFDGLGAPCVDESWRLVF